MIGGYTHGHPFDGLIVGYYEGTALKFAQKVRAGFVPRVRAEVFAAMWPLQTETCPFVNLPERRRTVNAITAAEMKNCSWLKPELVAQIEFTEWTPGTATCGTQASAVCVKTRTLAASCASSGGSWLVEFFMARRPGQQK